MKCGLTVVCIALIAASGPGYGDIVLSAGATVQKPNLPSYRGTMQANDTWYANVPFETATSYVSATGGECNTLANITWSIQIGCGPSNDDMAVADQEFGYQVRFDGNGYWRITPSLAGSLWVALGDRTARTVAHIRIPDTQDSALAVATKGFTVVAPQGGGGGGGA